MRRLLPILLLLCACQSPAPLPAQAPPARPALPDLVLPALVGVQTGPFWGSGVVVHPSGLVLTCSHVLRSERALVHFVDGRRRFARVLLDNETGDYALIQIEQPGPYFALAIAPRGPARGEPVTLFGLDTQSLPRWAEGRVLMPRISLPSTGASSDVRGEFYFRDAIIHSALAQGGDSGGPLVDGAGRVLGINVAFGGSLMTVAQSAARFGPALERLARHERMAQVASDPGLAALRASQVPRTVQEEVRWTLEGLVAYAEEVAPGRRAEIRRLADVVRRRAASLPGRLPGRLLFKWVWRQFLTPLGLPDPLQAGFSAGGA